MILVMTSTSVNWLKDIYPRPAMNDSIRADNYQTDMDLFFQTVMDQTSGDLTVAIQEEHQ
jgi:hypothetical protein